MNVPLAAPAIPKCAWPRHAACAPLPAKERALGCANPILPHTSAPAAPLSHCPCTSAEGISQLSLVSLSLLASSLPTSFIPHRKPHDEPAYVRCSASIVPFVWLNCVPCPVLLYPSSVTLLRLHEMRVSLRGGCVEWGREPGGGRADAVDH